MRKLAIDIKKAKHMYINRYLLPLILSVFLNMIILYALNNTNNVVMLSNSSLTIGSEEKSLLENMKVSMISKSSATTNHTTNNIAPIKSSAKQNKVNKMDVNVEKPTRINNETINSSNIHNENEKTTDDNISNNSNDIISANSNAKPLITSKAELSKAPPPISYPVAAIKENAYGKVTLGALISENGDITKIKVVKSSGYHILDEAAIKWFSKLKFRPALSGNDRISSNVTQVVSFSLEDAKKNEA